MSVTFQIKREVLKIIFVQLSVEEQKMFDVIKKGCKILLMYPHW